MLPFLKLKQQKQGASVLTKVRQPDSNDTQTQSDDQDPAESIHQCAKDLISAVHAGDSRKAAEAMYDAFCILEMQPHDEAEHEEKASPHSYDAQNQLAAKNRE